MRKIFYTLMAAITLNAQAAAFEQEVITIDYGRAVAGHYPGLSGCEWSYDGEEFTVFHDEQEFEVLPEFVDPKLKNITKKQLISFLENGYLYINRLDDGQFTIKAKVRGDGGALFLILGVIGVKYLANAIFDGPHRGEIVRDMPVRDLPQRPEVVVRQVPIPKEVAQKVVEQPSVLVSDANKVHVVSTPETPQCVTGPGIPLRPVPIIGGGSGAGKGPLVRVPKELFPKPTTTPPAPRPTPPAPRIIPPNMRPVTNV